jgi:choline monooxygenase
VIALGDDPCSTRRRFIVTAIAEILSPQMLEAINRSTQDAICLPNAAYTAAAFLDAERKSVFAENWIFLSVGAEIPDAGDVLPVVAAGLPLLLVRDAAGAIRAFHNVCRHRGTQLVGEKQKRRPKLVCRYHSWTYELDGKLVMTPFFGGPDNHESPCIDRGRMGLEPVQCDSWNDLVFVNPSGTAPPLAEHLEPLTRRWSHYDFSLLRYGGSCRFDVTANWKLAMENFLESYHLPFAHPTLNAASKMEAHYSIVEELYLGQGSDGYEPGIAGHADLPRFPGLTAAQQKTAEYPTLLPNLMLGLHPDYLFVFGVDPVAPDRTAETFYFYFIGDAALSDAFADARKNVVELWRKTNLEDIVVVEGMQIGRRSPGYHDGRFSPYHEVTTHEFQRRIANQMANRA